MQITKHQYDGQGEKVFASSSLASMLRAHLKITITFLRVIFRLGADSSCPAALLKPGTAATNHSFLLFHHQTAGCLTLPLSKQNSNPPKENNEIPLVAKMSTLYHHTAKLLNSRIIFQTAHNTSPNKIDFARSFLIKLYFHQN